MRVRLEISAAASHGPPGLWCTASRTRAEAPGRAAEDSDSSQPRLRPWPLPPARVWSSTPLFGSERTGEALSAQGADAAINLRASPPSAALNTGECSSLASHPQPARHPALPVTAQGIKPGTSPFSREGVDWPFGATTSHPRECQTPRWPGAQQLPP